MLKQYQWQYENIRNPATKKMIILDGNRFISASALPEEKVLLESNMQMRWLLSFI